MLKRFMKKEIKYIPYGIACRVGNTIYLNNKLKSYRKLQMAILKHESNHTEGFTARDIFLDLEIKELKDVKRDYYKFILQNPSSWIEFLPFKKYGGTVLFNLPIFFLWIMAAFMLWFILRGV